MTIIHSAVALAAFSVWLTVQIINPYERWVMRTLTVVAGIPVSLCAELRTAVLDTLPAPFHSFLNGR